MTPQQLTEEYIFAHDLREASAKIYRAATKALLKHFGPTATVQDVDHRAVLLNIWTIKVSGPRKTKELKAYLLQDPKLLFPVQPLDNPSLTVITDAEGGVE
ncbi:hypothetical protein IPC761_31775 [Pseudomonas aeruginosa]|nr:hypothetical protein IPC761_31775 [Pseudomonas aeruginosa]